MINLVNIFYSQQNSLFVSTNIKNLNGNRSVNHGPMSETSDSSFVEHISLRAFEKQKTVTNSKFLLKT